MPNIHPSSVVDKKAEIAKDAEIGPFCVVGPDVTIGAGTRLWSHVVIGGRTTVGERCTLFPNVSLGLDPQDKKAKDVKGLLVIGNENIIHECVTMHSGSQNGSTTKVGDRNFFMNYSHIGHDCQLGNDIIVTNAVQLGGFVEVEDKAVFGGVMGVHQYVRIGRLSMVGGMSKVTNDVPPFSLCDGNPFRFRGTNLVGLRRAEFNSARIQAVKKALLLLFASGKNRSGTLDELKKEFHGNSDIDHLISFVQRSKRGVVRAASQREMVEETS